MFRSKHPRDIFNEIKWRFDLNKCRIYYIHRGAPGDMRIAEGSMIKDIEKSFLVMEGIEVDAYIPYHRITRIDFNDEKIFEKHIRPLPKKKH